jgi:threonine dehydrogenase-like Zn-dependent dehydrogenase
MPFKHSFNCENREISFSISISISDTHLFPIIFNTLFKLRRAKELGVNHLINYKQIPGWEKEVIEITNGIGVDHVVEVVGGSHINRSMDVVALDGTISIIGLIGGLTGDINTRRKLFGNETMCDRSRTPDVSKPNNGD